MATEIVDIADLDCIYLTYDEPQKEKFWVEISNMVPWAKRVDGVKGSDAAHKAAADASSTERFILIDGDNLPDPEFFNLQLRLDESNKDCVFRWKAKNSVNGLMYGNGGISCWTREFVRNMKTHENSEGDDATDIEFCFDSKYIPMHNCYSTSYINFTPFQAWRAGFREGIKLSLNRGKRVHRFPNDLPQRNLDHLAIWQSVGMDTDHGEYAIMGAREGSAIVSLPLLQEVWGYNNHTISKADLAGWGLNDGYKNVQDFDKLDELWKTFHEVKTYEQTLAYIEQLIQHLTNYFDMPIVTLDEAQSKFFKHHYDKSQTNLDIMTKEIDIIRKHEGW